MKRIFKWLFRLFLVAVVLLVIFFLSLDSILRLVIEHNLRAQTGMEVEIGKFHLGLMHPVIHVENLRLNNPKDFGGTPLMIIPEIHAEYDQPALARHELHVTLLRFNLGELDIVKNEAGQTNLFALGLSLPTKDSLAKSHDLENFKKRTGFDFKGIDLLEVSVGSAKYVDLKDSKNNREAKIAIENVPLKNVKTPVDLAGLVVLIALRSDHFFESLVSPEALK